MSQGNNVKNIKKTSNPYAEKGRKGIKKGNPGRPKGAKDKFNRDLKDAFLNAFFDKDGIGGAGGIKKLLKNSNRNKLAFLNMIAKMLPSNIDVDHSGQIDSKLTIEVVETK